MALQHHERLDGLGYPSGLKGEEMLIEAKILAVADVVEARALTVPWVLIEHSRKSLKTKAHYTTLSW
jgi:HD-GYP domain-containing protein (c-di-GMP phosphodiesterase class II)